MFSVTIHPTLFDIDDEEKKMKQCKTFKSGDVII